jgi:hypothetical protein
MYVCTYLAAHFSKNCTIPKWKSAHRLPAYPSFLIHMCDWEHAWHLINSTSNYSLELLVSARHDNKWSTTYFFPREEEKQIFRWVVHMHIPTYGDAFGQKHFVIIFWDTMLSLFSLLTYVCRYHFWELGCSFCQQLQMHNGTKFESILMHSLFFAWSASFAQKMKHFDQIIHNSSDFF